ncbi:MAG: hypothetical protein M1570_06495 [Chloroflexi bacterium]|nr:hypothetical protein [Chloroflexota bacterium]
MKAQSRVGGSALGGGAAVDHEGMKESGFGAAVFLAALLMALWWPM